MVGGLRKERAGDFHSGSGGSGLESIVIQELRCRSTARVCFDMHRIAHDRGRAGLDLCDVYRAKVRSQTQRQSFFGVQHAAFQDGRARRAWLSGLLRHGCRVFGVRGEHRERKLCSKKNSGQRPEQRGVAR